MDHRSLWNKDREKQGRKRKRWRESESEGNEIVKGKRNSARQRERERGEGVRETGCSGPPGQTIAARRECGSRAFPVPKVHSCRLGQAGRSKPPCSSSGVAPSEANGQFWNKSLGCYGDDRNRETLFRFLMKRRELMFFIHFEQIQNRREKSPKRFVYTFRMFNEVIDIKCISSTNECIVLQFICVLKAGCAGSRAAC